MGIALCVIDQGKVSVFTRRGHNWADRMPSIARALSSFEGAQRRHRWRGHRHRRDGLSDFFSLHAALARKNAPRAVLVAFDLMFMGAIVIAARSASPVSSIEASFSVARQAPG